VRPRASARHGQVGLSPNSYGHSRRHGLIGRTRIHQFDNQSEQPNRENEDWLQSREFAAINWRKIMTARAARCPNRPLLVLFGCAATIHGTVQPSTPSAAGHEREPERAVINMITRRRGRFRLRAPRRWTRRANSSRPRAASSRRLQGGGEPHRLPNADRDGREIAPSSARRSSSSCEDPEAKRKVVKARPATKNKISIRRVNTSRRDSDRTHHRVP